MELAAYLLFALGILGALDIATYHTVAHGIRSHAASRNELITHSLRGPTYAALFLLVPNFEMREVYYWVLAALLVVDVGISIADFLLEKESRRLLGGLPSGEYVLHIFMAMVFGGLATSIGLQGTDWAATPSAIQYSPANVPVVVRGVMALMAVMVLVSGAQDALAAIRLQQRKGNVAHAAANSN